MLRFLTAADVLSIVNACFGLLAMLAVVSGLLVWAFVFIVLALLADGLDGIVARRLGSGQVGEYLEAMADTVSLTIAPLVFVYGVYVVSQPLAWQLLLVVGMVVFVFCSMTRLSAFHLLKEQQVFVGLPASASTIVVISLAILGPLWFPVWVLVAVLILLGLMKVSSLPFPKLGRRLTVVACVVILVSLVLVLWRSEIGALLLLVWVLVYILAGALLARRYPV
jgi:CDP-diacylglycerol--serine O-phosphatidyltransferase